MKRGEKWYMHIRKQEDIDTHTCTRALRLVLTIGIALGFFVSYFFSSEFDNGFKNAPSFFKLYFLYISSKDIYIVFYSFYIYISSA